MTTAGWNKLRGDGSEVIDVECDGSAISEGDDLRMRMPERKETVGTFPATSRRKKVGSVPPEPFGAAGR